MARPGPQHGTHRTTNRVVLWPRRWVNMNTARLSAGTVKPVNGQARHNTITVQHDLFQTLPYISHLYLSFYFFYFAILQLLFSCATSFSSSTPTPLDPLYMILSLHRAPAPLSLSLSTHQLLLLPRASSCSSQSLHRRLLLLPYLTDFSRFPFSCLMEAEAIAPCQALSSLTSQEVWCAF